MLGKKKWRALDKLCEFAPISSKGLQPLLLILVKKKTFEMLCSSVFSWNLMLQFNWKQSPLIFDYVYLVIFDMFHTKRLSHNLLEISWELLGRASSSCTHVWLAVGSGWLHRAGSTVWFGTSGWPDRFDFSILMVPGSTNFLMWAVLRILLLPYASSKTTALCVTTHGSGS